MFIFDNSVKAHDDNGAVYTIHSIQQRLTLYLFWAYFRFHYLWSIVIIIFMINVHLIIKSKCVIIEAIRIFE